jgi:hypothetical protein
MANKHIYAYKHIRKIIFKNICLKKMCLGVYMLRSICKKRDLGAQYAYKNVRITANLLILESKLARSHSAVERQDGDVQWCTRCCLKIHGKEVWE